MFDYWLYTRKKNPIRPAAHQISGGLMTAGIKPGELPSGTVPAGTANNAQANSTAAPQQVPQAASGAQPAEAEGE